MSRNSLCESSGTDEYRMTEVVRELRGKSGAALAGGVWT